MSQILNAPANFVHGALRAMDGGLENVSLAAEAVNRSFSALPPVTSDFNEREHHSIMASAIEAIRAQVQRGLPVTVPPLEAIVSFLSTFTNCPCLRSPGEDFLTEMDLLLVCPTGWLRSPTQAYLGS
jgi:hypothetical protein